MTSARVLVTGGAGFLGAAVCRALVRGGHSVLATVRPRGDAWRLSSIAESPLLRRWSIDLDTLFSVEGRREAIGILRAFEVETIIHCAWSGVRGAGRDAPAQFGNVAVTLEVIQAAAEAGARRFVGLGSQAEYGPHDRAIDETTPTRPRTLYGMAKLAAGHMAASACDRRGLESAWVRVFSVYGPHEREGALIPDLARALREGRPYPLGSGEALWDYLFEEDAGEALLRLALTEGACGFFNLGSGRVVPLRDVMRLVASMVAPEAPLLLGARPGGRGDLARLEADVGRLRAVTGWEPETALTDGIARTVEALR